MSQSAIGQQATFAQHWQTRPSAPPPGFALCRFDALADPGAKGFTFGAGRDRFEMFVVRQGARVFGYVNECPHARTTLEWADDRFLSLDKSRLLCATHGAQFRIDDGFCDLGPCTGRSLYPIPVAIIGGEVRIATTGETK